jgi:hypothetical protein
VFLWNWVAGILCFRMQKVQVSFLSTMLWQACDRMLVSQWPDWTPKGNRTSGAQCLWPVFSLLCDDDEWWWWLMIHDWWVSSWSFGHLQQFFLWTRSQRLRASVPLVWDLDPGCWRLTLSVE